MQKIPNTTWMAMACLVAGWFWLNTLVAAFGPVRHAVHFYELAAAIRDPRWLLYGGGQSVSVGSIVFGIVCLLVAVAPLLPRLGYPLLPRLMSAAPLLLMVLCGVTLYVKSASVHIEAQSMGRLGDYLARLANGATQWTGDVVARHIAVGAGAYLALLASGFLAMQGLVRRPAQARGEFIESPGNR